MHVARFTDAHEFLAAAGAFLGSNEELNTVALGLAERLTRSADWADAVHLACVVNEGGQVAGAAVRTNADLPVVLSAMTDAEALAALADDLLDIDPPPEALSGLRPSVDLAASLLAQRMGRQVVESMANRVYALTGVRQPQSVGGRMRALAEPDRELVLQWVDSFMREALPDEYHHGRSEALVDRLYRAGESVGRLWEVDGTPVSMALVGSRTRTCERISGVYTPPELRRHGYAGALVAALCQERLDAGRFTLTLYTDLSNPTSNHVYTDVGFQPIADAAILSLR